MLKAEVFLRDQQVFEPEGLIEGPAVSVILPTFRRGDGGLLERAILSVLSQSLQSFELIVVDDGSTDSTREVVERLQRGEPRLRYVRHDLNSGLPALRVNEGVALARAPYVAYQFDDDQWTFDALETLYAASVAAPEPSVVFGQSLYREDGRETLLGAPVTPYLLSLHNRFANNAVLHPRTFPEMFGGYDQHIAMRRLCDWDLWLRWISLAPFVFVETPVSIVDARQPGSIADTVPYDLPLFRAMAGQDRREALRTWRVFEQVVDADLPPEAFAEPIRQAARRQVGEYYARRRDVAAQVRPPDLYDRAVSVVSHVFDTSVDITFLNFRETSSAPIQLVPYAELAEGRQPPGGAAAFVRTFMAEADERLRTLSESTDTSTIYVLDDDLPNFFEMDPTLDYLAPGHPQYAAMIDSITAADVCFAYSSVIAETLARWNPRLVEQRTNIPARWLPAGPRPPREGPIRIGFAGTGARAEEFAALWPAVERLSDAYGERIAWSFWGFTPPGAETLASPVQVLPYVTGYGVYLRRLTAAGFDIMLAPLFERWRAKRAKSPIKLLEIAAAGAVGVYSDATAYAVVDAGVDGFKASDHADAWYDAVAHVIEMGHAARSQMVAASLAKVRRDWTTEALSDRFQAGLAAADFHRASRHARGLDGRPTVGLLAGAAATPRERRTLDRQAAILARHGVRPVVFGLAGEAAAPGVDTVPLTSEQLTDPVALAEAFARHGCSLVHAAGAHSAGEKAARLAQLPIAVAVGLEPPPDPEVDVVDADIALCRSRGIAGAWIDGVGVPAVHAADPLPDEAFARLESLPAETGLLRLAVPGVFTEGSGHADVLRAVAWLRETGLEVRLLLLSAGSEAADADLEGEAVRWGVQDLCERHADLDAVQADAWLYPAARPDPADLLSAMAAGRLVIAGVAGPAGEVHGAATGVALDSPDYVAMARALRVWALLGAEERDRRRRLAWSTARSEAGEPAVARALLSSYVGLFAAGDARRQAAVDAVARTLIPPTSSGDVRTLDELHARLADRVDAAAGALMQRVIATDAARADVARAADEVARVAVEVDGAREELRDLLTDGTARLDRDLAEALERSADAAYVDEAVSALAREKIGRERDRARPLQALHRWNARRRDLTGVVQASWFADWLDDPANVRAPGERIQLQRFWRAGEGERFVLPCDAGRVVEGFDLAPWVFVPPFRAKPVLRFQLLENDAVVRDGCCVADRATGREALRARFDPVTASGPLSLTLVALPAAEDVGLKLYEIRRIQPLTHRVLRRRLLHRLYPAG